MGLAQGDDNPVMEVRVRLHADAQSALDVGCRVFPVNSIPTSVQQH